MRILFLVSRILSQVRGGPDLRVQSQIAAFAQLGSTAVFSIEHSIAQPISGVEVWSSGDHYPDTVSVPKKELISNLFIEDLGPYHYRYRENTALRLSSILESFQPDFIIVSKLEQTAYLKILENYSKGRLILDLDESSRQVLRSIPPLISHKVSQLLNTKFLQSVCDYESKVLSRFDQIWVSSELEVERLIEQYGVNTPVVNIPNCVDFNKYVISTHAKRINQIIFPANFGYLPNEDAAMYLTEEIIPIMSDFEFHFVGAAMPKWMLDLQIKNVRVICDVPSMAKHIADAGILVIPLRAGAGTRFKALEAFASKTPVVSSKIGVEGLDVTNGKHVLIAETPEEFSAACRNLVSNPELFTELTDSAYEHGRDNFSYSTLLQMIERELQF